MFANKNTSSKPEFPVHFACSNGNLLKVQQELSKIELSHEKSSTNTTATKGAKFPLRGVLTQKDNDGRTLLHWCVSMQHENMLDYLIEKYNENKIDIDDLFDDAGWNPVHIASNTTLSTTRKLFTDLKIKPDANKQTLKTLSTPLHISCSKVTNLPIISYLIVEQKASVRIKDKMGRLPIHIASCIDNSIDVIKILCEHDSPVNVKDSIDGWTPMHHAMAEGNLGVAIYLVQEYDADYKTITSNDDKTPLDVAVSDTFKETFLENI